MVKINMSIPFMVIFVCAWYFKMLIPMLIWCVMFLMLRNYIGGYHAKRISDVFCIAVFMEL